MTGNREINMVAMLKDKYGTLKKNGYRVYLRGGNTWFGNQLLIHGQDLFELRDVEGHSLFFTADGITAISI